MTGTTDAVAAWAALGRQQKPSAKAPSSVSDLLVMLGGGLVLVGGAWWLMRGPAPQPARK